MLGSVHIKREESNNKVGFVDNLAVLQVVHIDVESGVEPVPKVQFASFFAPRQRILILLLD
jgi:hypothetical protein